MNSAECAAVSFDYNVKQMNTHKFKL